LEKAQPVVLSVIIPTYNRISLIKYTLDSLDKRYHNKTGFEVIVVDDGSTDGTWKFIESNYPHIKLIRNNAKGAGAARNAGLAQAQGKYIVYLDSDDLVGERFFDQKINLLETNSDLDACYGEYDFFRSDSAFDTEKIIFKYKYPLITSADNARQHLINYLGGNFLPPNSIVWRKDLLLKINGHDPSLGINQDVDLFIRAIFNGLKIEAVADGAKVYIRDHVLDNRVGDPKNGNNKWEQILALRKKIYKDMAAYGYGEEDCYRALGHYLFSYWKLLRHKEPEIAQKFLAFSKEVYWPVQIKGNAGYKMLSKVFGPVGAVNIKYFLLKRD
jgi:glycosyltransferase involved in cell wall biosynthesis